MTSKGPAKNVLVDVWLISGLSRALVEEVLRGSGLTPDEFAVYGLVDGAAVVVERGLPSGRHERRNILRPPAPSKVSSVAG